MTHYEFKHSKKGKKKYRGSWTETTPNYIDLPFTVESMKTVLIWGTKPNESPYTHQDIAHWCDRFHMAMFDIETDSAMDIATGVALDVDAQWGMFLANTYKLEELQKLDFSTIRVPVDWRSSGDTILNS